jgi:hypothetical protein
MQMPEVDAIACIPAKPSWAGLLRFPDRQHSKGGSGIRRALCRALLHHTDEKREWAYDRISKVGRLEKALEMAPEKGLGHGRHGS